MPSTPSTRSESSDLPTPASALVVAAHPDDAEFQCGATLAKWARLGTEIHHLVLTDGSKGTWDPDVDQAALVARRQAEQRSASEVLGGRGRVVFLGEVDGDLHADGPTTRTVCRILREIRPEVILAHDPWKRYRLHPDHAAAGELTVNAIVAARDPFFHPDQIQAGFRTHRVTSLLLFEPDEVNHVESVSDADVELRLAALETHTSQLETTHFYKLDPGGSRESALEEFRHQQRRALAAAGDVRGVGFAEEYHLIQDQL